ncbi:hypothetical protein BDR26DRAFT_11281 [Obelidium mucronatum]|nr:hypothetical protein BDR26DRAFT_11281 [Obelidium mucronatum]
MASQTLETATENIWDTNNGLPPISNFEHLGKHNFLSKSANFTVAKYSRLQGETRSESLGHLEKGLPRVALILPRVASLPTSLTKKSDVKQNGKSPLAINPTAAAAVQFIPAINIHTTNSHDIAGASNPDISSSASLSSFCNGGSISYMFLNKIECDDDVAVCSPKASTADLKPNYSKFSRTPSYRNGYDKELQSALSNHDTRIVNAISSAISKSANNLKINDNASCRPSFGNRGSISYTIPESRQRSVQFEQMRRQSEDLENKRRESINSQESATALVNNSRSVSRRNSTTTALGDVQTALSKHDTKIRNALSSIKARNESVMVTSALSSISSLYSDYQSNDDLEMEPCSPNTAAAKRKPVHFSTVVNARVLARRATRNFRYRSLWRWAIRKVIRMIHATNAITINRTFFKYDQNEVNDGSNEDLEFNLDRFKAKAKPLGGSERVTEALLKVPGNRSEEDVIELSKMMKGLPGFSSYSKETKMAMGRVIGYSKFGAGRTILKQGHVAQNFYFIMSGQLEVYKETDSRTHLVLTMSTGQSFGELALLGPAEAKRQATVITTKETELLWLTRDDFEPILKHETIRSLNERITLISNSPFFARFGKKVIRSLAQTAQVVEVQPNTHIITEGDVPKYVYLVCEGQCHLSKCIHLAKVKTSPDTNRFKLHPYPLPSTTTTTTHGSQKITRLARITKINEGEHYGTASAFASVGSPSQIATLGSFLDISKATKSGFSLTAATSLKYVAINKHTFVKEMQAFPDLVRRVAVDYLGLMEVLEGDAAVERFQRLYLERCEWMRYKDHVLGDTLKHVVRRTGRPHLDEECIQGRENQRVDIEF